MAQIDYAGIAQVILALASLVAAIRGSQDWRRWKNKRRRTRRNEEGGKHAADDE